MSEISEGKKNYHRVTALEFSLEFQNLLKKAKSDIKSYIQQSIVQEKMVQANLRDEFNNYDDGLGDKARKGYEDIKSLHSLVLEKMVQANFKDEFTNYSDGLGDKAKKGYDLNKSFFQGVVDSMQKDMNRVLDEVLDGVIKTAVLDEISFTKKPKSKNVHSTTLTNDKVHSKSTSARMDCSCPREKRKRKKKKSLFRTIVGMLFRRRRRRRRMRKQMKLQEQLRKREELRNKKK